MKEIPKIYIEHFKEFEKTMSLNELLIKASSYGVIEYIEKYLDMGADINFRDREYSSPLYHAIGYDDLSAAEYLIKRGADVNNPPGMMADFIELESDYHYEVEYRANKESLPKMKIIKLLMKYGADPNRLNFNGNTLLEQIIRYFDIDEVNLVLKYGADINLKNKDGETPLDIAIKKDKKKIIDLLKKNGAKLASDL